MPADKVALFRPDGLHILAQATLTQLAEDTTLAGFADGLVTKALNHISRPEAATRTLAETLGQPDPSTNPLLTALLVLDAELSSVIEDETRVFPLPGFLTYHARLPLDRFALNTVRLPPLNPDGHYALKVANNGFYCAIRLDLHPGLKVAGHVRLAVSSPTRPPVRLRVVEHRLERQKLTTGLIEMAIRGGNEELAPEEQNRLIKALQAIIET